MALLVIINGFLLMAAIKETSSELDLWKKLNRGGAPTKIVTNDIALYLIDQENNLKAIDSDGAMKDISSWCPGC